MIKRMLIATLLLFSFFSAASAIHTAHVFAADPAPNEEVKCDNGAFAPDNDRNKCVTTDGTNSNYACGGGNFLGFPKWYKYLKSQVYTDNLTGAQSCNAVVEGVGDIWKIVAAVIEFLTRVASLVAIGFVVYGGFTYTLSQGNPDKTKQSLKTVINAAVGLVIAVIATAVVSFIAGRF